MSDQSPTNVGRTPPGESIPDPVRARWADDGVVDAASLATYRSALEFVLGHHVEVRKGGRGVPYLAHLLDVSSTVFEDGGTLEAAIAGLLHDVVEDQNVSYDQITAMFGERVAAIVRGCTDSGELRPGEAKGPFLERKKAHLAGLADRARRIVAGSPHPEDVEVLTVTAADKLSNLRATLGDLDDSGPGYFDHFKGGLFVTHWYYATVTEVLEWGRPGSRAVRDLRRALTRLETDWLVATRSALADRAAALPREFARLDAGDPRFGRGRTDRMSAETERTLVAFEALRVADAARAGGTDPRATVEQFLLDCFVPGAAKRWRADGKPVPADLVRFADAVLAG